VTDNQQKLWIWVDQHRQSYIQNLQNLVRVSQGGEDIVQQAITANLKRLDCQVEVIRHTPRSIASEFELADPDAVDTTERVSVVGKWSGSGGGQSIILFAHPDSEPIAETETWEHDPFAGEIENGRLYGWGAADDLLGIAAMLSGFEALLAAGFKPLGTVILASTPSKRRAQGIIAVLDEGYVADAAIYLHPAESGAGLKDIKATTSGLLRFRITVPGAPPDTCEPTHTPFYHLAVNPIDKAWLVYQSLQALADRRAREIHHPALAAAVGRSTNLQIAYINCGDEKQLSRVSSEAVLAGSVTFPPTEKIIDVQSQISQAVEAAANNDAWLKEHPPQLEWVMGTSGVGVPADSPLYQTVSQAIRAVTGIEPAVHPLHSASDIRNPLLHKGIPTVGFGSLAGDLTQAGGHDEWVDVEDYLAMVKVVGSIILDWCGG
jgi:acetylornithine deacetylase